MCEKYRDELVEAVTKQMGILEEKQKLAMALQKAEDCYNHPLEKTADRLKPLDETRVTLSTGSIGRPLPWMRAQRLHDLQREQNDPGMRNINVHAHYCKLLQSQSALKNRYDWLSYVQGKVPEFCPLPVREPSPQGSVSCQYMESDAVIEFCHSLNRPDPPYKHLKSALQTDQQTMESKALWIALSLYS